MRSESLGAKHHQIITQCRQTISIVLSYIRTTCNVLWFSLQAILALDIDTYRCLVYKFPLKLFFQLSWLVRLPKFSTSDATSEL
jgi:hypothetical protein